MVPGIEFLVLLRIMKFMKCIPPPHLVPAPAATEMYPPPHLVPAPAATEIRMLIVMFWIDHQTNEIFMLIR